MCNVQKKSTNPILKQALLDAIKTAERAAYQYAVCCPLGEERERAFEVYENIRTAIRVG